MKQSFRNVIRILSVISVLSFSTSAFAVNFYVKTTGNNASVGTGWGTAFQTISYAISRSNNGDIIYVEGGTYTEQLEIVKAISIIGSQNAGSGISRTVIKAPAWGTMTSITDGTNLNWTGADKIQSSTFNAVIYVNATTNTTAVYLKGIDVDGDDQLVQTGTTMFFGIAFKTATGTIGGAVGDSVRVYDVKSADAVSNAKNLGIGVAFFGKAAPTMSHVRIYDYRNAGIAVLGSSTSSLSSTVANQPNPTIQDNVITGSNFSGTTSEDFIQAGILIANGGRSTTRRNLIWKNRCGTTNYVHGRFAYGMFLYDARANTIGDVSSTKSNGNLITDNEIGLYVRITTSTIPTSQYTIRQNVIAYNGNMTPCGKKPHYSVAASDWTTYGAVRFTHTPTTSQTLTLASNAWGNSEANSFFSISPTGATYTNANYNTTKVAFWRQMTEDNISATTPLSSPVATTMLVNSSYSPGTEPSGAGFLNGMNANLSYGYSNFNSLRNAVYAAVVPATGSPATIEVSSNITEDSTIIIHKRIRINGTVSTCASRWEIKLADGVDGPTFWLMGLHTASPSNDPIARQPDSIRIDNFKIIKNNTQSINWGYAFLVTGATSGNNTPLGTRLSGMALDPLFVAASGYAISTTQNAPSTSLRWGSSSQARSVVNAKNLYRLDCSTITAGVDVWELDDNNSIARVMYDNTTYVTSCNELQDAIAAAEIGSPTTIVNTVTLDCPTIYVENIATIRLRAQTTPTAVTLRIQALDLNGSGTNSTGGNLAVCDFKKDAVTSTININRINIWPPACLQNAVDLINSDPTSIISIADGNSTYSTLAFSESTTNELVIAKSFDFMGALKSSVRSVTPTAGNATFSGIIKLNSGADIIKGNTGTFTSTNGTSFGTGADQVQLSFTATSGSLTNFGGNAIDMSLQLINSNSGSSKLALTRVGGVYATENPTINTRVYLYGLANRGSSTGTITLNGSGNCASPSKLVDINVSNMVVATINDCIQTTLGDAASQSNQGIGTSSVNGSGGSVSLSNLTYSQDVEIAKSVTFTSASQPLSAGNEVTLRRGASPTGLSDFAMHVIMNQASSWSGATNPVPTDAMSIVIDDDGGASIIDIAGYGDTDNTGGVPLTGSSPGGVWQFNNVLVTKSVVIRGAYYNLGSTDYTDCSALDVDVVPSYNSSLRSLSSETVIGSGSSTYSVGTSPVFDIQSDNVDIIGFQFNNISSSNTTARAMVTDNYGYDNISVNNNIISISGSGAPTNIPGLVLATNTTSSKDLWTINNNRVIASGFSNNTNPLVDFRNAGNTISGSATEPGLLISENVVNPTSTGSSLITLDNISGNLAEKIQVLNNYLNDANENSLYLSTSGGANRMEGILIKGNSINTFGNTVSFSGLKINLNSYDPGTAGILVRNNVFTTSNSEWNIDISGLAGMSINRIYIDSNRIEGFSGIKLTGVVLATAPISAIFNYWNDNMGPIINSLSYNLPDRTDPLYTIYPFVSTNGVEIHQDVDWNTAALNDPGAKFSILPVVISSTDRESGTCGWQPQDVMGPVLRMNTAGDIIKGTYNNITEARDDENPGYSFDTYWGTYPSGTREATDEIWVLGTNNGNPTGYLGIEPFYPVEFPNPSDPTNVLEPSAIRGYLGAQGIITAGKTGMISVTNSRNSGFEIDNLDVENRSSHPTVTVFDFANTSGDDYIHDCVFTDDGSASPIQYTGINYLGNSNGRFQVENNTTTLIDADNYTGISIAGANLANTTNISVNELNTDIITNNAIGILVTDAGTGMSVDNNILTSTQSDNYTGIDLSGFAVSEDIIVDNNNINASTVGNTFTGISVDASGNSIDVDIASNTVSGENSLTWLGIVAKNFGGSSPRVNNNILAATGSQTDGSGITVENLVNGSQINVEYNSLSNTSVASGTFYGVQALGTGTSLTLDINHNTLNGGSDTYYGVHSSMTGATLTTVELNTIAPVGLQIDFNGVYVQGISNTNTVEVINNTIDNPGGASGTYQGIYFDGTSNGAVLESTGNDITGGGANFFGIQSAASNVADFRVFNYNTIRSDAVNADQFIGIDAGTFSTTNPEYIEIVDNYIGDVFGNVDIYETSFTGITGIGSNSALSSIDLSSNTITGKAVVGGFTPPEFTGITFTNGGSTFSSTLNTISYDGSDIYIVKGIELNDAAITSTSTISDNIIGGQTYALSSFTGINVNGSTPTDATVTHSSNTITGGGVVYTGIENTISNKGTLTSSLNEVTSETGANNIDEFTGITLSNFKTAANIDVSDNEVGHDGTGANSTNLSNTGWAKGIEIFANNVTSGTVSQNNVRFMSANTAEVAVDAAKGAAIYIKNADGLNIFSNTLDGGNQDNSRGNNGIVLDGATGTGNYVAIGASGSGNSIAQTTSLFQDKQVSPELGYGIKVFDKAGGVVDLQASINDNTIGDNNSGCASGAIYVGGTSGEIKNGLLPFEITNNTIKGGNAANTNNGITSSLGAAIQIATSVYTLQPMGGSIEISSNTVGGVISGEGNSMDLAIGTTTDGISTSTNADNLSIDVLLNTFRTHSQTIAHSYDIADARPYAGENIRNIFGYQNGTTDNGVQAAGRGISGNNTFSFATILTGEDSPEDYTVAMARTKDAQVWNTGEPVRISRLLTSLNTGVTCLDISNTLEMRETAGYTIGSDNTYWTEDFTFTDKRALLLGPAGSVDIVDMLAPATGASVQTTGRQNKDVRGNIRFNVIGTSKNAGKVSTTQNDKGDVYLQLGAAGTTDSPVSFRYHSATLASLISGDVTGRGNSTARVTDIKALINDADDDGFTANDPSTRRTGVFRAGNGTQFTKEIAGAVSGSNLLEVYPSPANGDVTVNFIVPIQGFVSVDLYNTLGQKVTDITNGMFNADRYSASFNVSNLPSGTYQVRIANELFTKSTSIVVTK